MLSCCKIKCFICLEKMSARQDFVCKGQIKLWVVNANSVGWSHTDLNQIDSSLNHHVKFRCVDHDGLCIFLFIAHCPFCSWLILYGMKAYWELTFKEAVQLFKAVVCVKVCNFYKSSSGRFRNLERGVQPLVRKAHPKILGLLRPLPVT